ncbi:MAG: hypothetical protein ABJB76_05775 [Candidatus Nitrosocosmicus sp.]
MGNQEQNGKDFAPAMKVKGKGKKKTIAYSSLSTSPQPSIFG